MINTLLSFTSGSLFNAASALLTRLHIKFDSETAEPINFTDLYDQQMPKYLTEALACVDKTYFIGIVNDGSLSGNATGDTLSSVAETMAHEGKYDGMFVFACDVHSTANLTRSAASALTRAFNRIASANPVILILRQDKYISLATCERMNYTQEWRNGSGEKLGKVTMLRNMDSANLHPGHRQILERIADDVNGSATFECLYNKWLTSFNIDVLSDAFFDGYKNIYEDIIEYVTGKRMVKEGGKWVEKDNHTPCSEIMAEFAAFENPEKTVRDYVKNLLGRLVFIQFLQKKGWMGVPVGDSWEGGDPYFLQNLFASSDKKETFIDDVLEPLFNDLNTKRHLDLVTNPNVGINIKVPYLNGGLFELDECDDTTFALPSRFMEKLLNFFASFNFTIDENAPDDVEIGVDPEMLGRIFENLLEDNKEKGAFYTPKEIVQYMCRESLTAYLTTCVMKKQGENHQPEERIRESVRQLLSNPSAIVPRMTPGHLNDFGKYIREVKICDPAIGSGAFPMGLLNELVRCRVAIDAWAKDEYDNLLIGDYAALKAEIICNNIYGVDIERGAIDIARLRFWLSIIVDLKMPHALPNFDYKFMQGNSLITTFNGVYVNLDTKNQQHVRVADMRAEKLKLYNLKQKYYGSQGNQKHELAVEIKKSILRLVSMQLGYELRAWAQRNAVQSALDFNNQGTEVSFSEITRQLPKEKQELVSRAQSLYKQLNDETIDIAKRALIDINFFDWRMMFTEVFDSEDGGFDIVIGNPPYVESRNSSIDESQKNAIQQQLLVRHSKEDAECFPRGADLLVFFFELSFSIASSSGINTFITENSWLSTDYGFKFQKFILKKINTLAIVDSDYKYFDTADINTVITFFENTGLREICDVPFVHCHGNLSIHPYNIQADNVDETITVKRIHKSESILSCHKWGFLFSIDDRLLQLLDEITQKENKTFRSKIDVGQGLNLTKDCILTEPTACTSPYFISEDGPLYRWTTPSYYVDKAKISATRKNPVLIMPRGLGTHFCCINEVGGYSASYVEIYEKKTLSLEEKLKIWIFCNSSLCWLLREFTGRCNLGGGMLKAEATDMKRIPLCFDFDNLDEIKSIYNDSLSEKVPTNIDSALASSLHRRIDKLVFSYEKLHC